MKGNFKSPVLVFLLFVLVGVCPAISVAESFRESIISGYHEACMEDKSQKGLDEESATRVCDCEARVFDENYSTMSMVLLGVRGASGEKPSEDEFQELRKKMRACSE